MNTFKHVKKTLVDAAKDAGETLVDTAKSARDAVVDAKDAVVDAATTAKDAMVDAATNAKDKTVDAMENAASGVADAASNVKDKTLDAAQDAKEMILKIADTVTDNVSEVIADLTKRDILDMLKADHELVAGFFEQIEATSRTSRTMREGLFEQLKYELEVHSSNEEKLFYAALRKGQGAGALMTEAHTDHELVQQLLLELAEQPVDSEAWLAQLRVLKENVERHVQMEEVELFARARELMNTEQREDLGVRFEASKQRLNGGEGTDRGARGHQAQRSSRKTATKKSSRGHHTESAHRV